MEPLAYKYRPQDLDEFVGQAEVVGLVEKFLKLGRMPSMIFWGPPGTGKTTMAFIIARRLKAEFFRLSAVIDGKAELKKIIALAQVNKTNRKLSLLFIDEIHRWSKAQQDALLPYVEDGTIVLIGATTENPSFTVISALLSRSQVFVFEPLTKQEIKKVLLKIIGQEEIFKTLKIDEDVVELIADLANGDLRVGINILEMAMMMAVSSAKDKQAVIDKDMVKAAVQKSLRYDRDGDEHYHIISAVHKSLRSSNGSAAAYWIMRMLEAGEDPLYIARRLLRFASEDIGNAKPTAILLANVTYDACHKIGMPECRVFLIQLALYLAACPKNNTAYMVENLALADVKKYGNLPVPLHLRNAPTKFEKAWFWQGV